jgi:hypothetical protein
MEGEDLILKRERNLVVEQNRLDALRKNRRSREKVEAVVSHLDLMLHTRGRPIVFRALRRNS